MAVISKGIKLYVGEEELTNLQEIPELGGDVEAIEITTLADEAHTYTDGIKNYGDSLTFKFIYEKEQFASLRAKTRVLCCPCEANILAGFPLRNISTSSLWIPQSVLPAPTSRSKRLVRIFL